MMTQKNENTLTITFTERECELLSYLCDNYIFEMSKETQNIDIIEAVELARKINDEWIDF